MSLLHILKMVYVEAVELKNKKFNLGIQWHPEQFSNEDVNNNIFKIFIGRCSK